MMNAAIYARYSTDRQSESSIADQARLCRTRCEAEGWAVLDLYADHGVSGSIPVAARPGGAELLADSRFQVLVPRIRGTDNGSGYGSGW